MTAEINPDCPHVNFEDGVCDECDYRCEHQWDVQDDICLECGKQLEPMTEDDYYDAKGMEDHHDAA